MKKRTLNWWLTVWVALLCRAVVAQPPVQDNAYRVIQETYAYDTALPLQASVIDTTQFTHFTRYTLTYAGTQERLTAYLAVPKTNRAPYPVVLLVEGMGGDKEQWFIPHNWPNGLATTEALIARGFAVFTLDAAHHGERADTTGVLPPASQWRKNNLLHTIYQTIHQTVLDYRRGLDCLNTFGMLNNNQYGVYGLSMGGAVTFILTAIEPRIKTAVAGLTVVYGSQNSWVNAFNFAPWINQKPFMMLMGTNDGFYTPQMAKELFYTLGGHSNRLVFFKGGHKVPEPKVELVADWFKQHLF